ncbi:MAG: hypothetical protein K2X82_14090 [Gemmataceae bacterium]|nr:hypothetical protein [Gemmataceae bacterium]
MPTTTDRYRLLGRLAAAGAVVGAVGLTVWLVLDRDRLRRTYNQSERVAATRRESASPVVAELADETVRPGDPIDAVITKHPPTHLIHHDPYTTALYVEGNRETYLAARDGRLVWARQCGAGVVPCTFFSTFTPDEERDYGESLQRALAVEAGRRSVARMAVVGAAAEAGQQP